MTDFKFPARTNGNSRIRESKVDTTGMFAIKGVGNNISKVNDDYRTTINNASVEMSMLDFDELNSTMSFHEQLSLLNKNNDDFRKRSQLTPSSRNNSLNRKRSEADQLSEQNISTNIDLYELARSVQPDCSYKLINYDQSVSAKSFSAPLKLAKLNSNPPAKMDTSFEAKRSLSATVPSIQTIVTSALCKGKIFNIVIRSNNDKSNKNTNNCSTIYSGNAVKQFFTLPQSTIPDPISIFISNIVTIIYTGCCLNLRSIAMTGFNVVFKRNMNKVTMMNRKPYGFANIWSSGKITCSGATSNEDARKLSRRIARCIQKLGFPVRFCNYRVVNVFAHCNMPFNIDLPALYRHVKKANFINSIIYEPELNPGATIKINEHRVTMKVFATGSITVIGPTVTSLETSCQMIYPIMRNYARLNR